MMRYLARRVGRIPPTSRSPLRTAAFRTAAFRLAAPALVLAMALALAACQSSPHEPESSDAGTATEAGANAGTSQVAQAPSRPPRSTRSLPTPKPTPRLPDFAAESVLVQVLMKEYAYLPNPLTLKSGQRTTLALINRGTMAHQFQIGRDAAPDKTGFKEDLFAGIEVKMGTSPEDAPKATPEGKDASSASDSASDSASGLSTESNSDSDSSSSAADSSVPVRAVVPAGGTVYMTFTLPPDRRGDWEMGCFEKQHYGSGMSGKVRVE